MNILETSRLIIEEKYQEALDACNQILMANEYNLYGCYGKLFSLSQLAEASHLQNKKIEYLQEAKILATKVLDNWEVFKYNSNKEELSDMANYCLAKYFFITSSSKEDLQKALLHINRAGDADYKRALKVEILLQLNLTNEVYRIVLNEYQRIKRGANNSEEDAEDEDFPIINGKTYFQEKGIYYLLKTNQDFFKDIRETNEYQNWIDTFLETYFIPHANETAYEAIIRLKEYIKLYDSGETIGKVTFSEPIPISEIEEIEKEWNIHFPSSYKNFISTYGLFSLKHHNYKLLSFEEMLTALKYYKEWSIEADKISDSIIPFQKGWEVGYEQLFLFYTQPKVNNNEMNIKAWSETGDVPGGNLVIQKYGPDITNSNLVSFDEHISTLVTDLVREVNDSDLYKNK